MSEESKYYTPEMEEFHPGFEFKYLNHNGEWKDCELGKNDIENIELRQYKDDLMKIAHANLRVKFLDREDIESLGWKWIDKKNSGKNFYEGTFENSTRGLMYFEHDWLNNKITIKSPNFIRDGSGRFDGFCVVIDRVVIKNKSELRKLMQMLGVK